MDAGMATEAYKRWLTMEEPTWAKLDYPKPKFNEIYYYSAPKGSDGPKSLDEVDPELLRTYEKLGIPLQEQEILAGVSKKTVNIRGSRSMRCSIPCRWQPPSRPSLKKRA